MQLTITAAEIETGSRIPT